MAPTVAGGSVELLGDMLDAAKHVGSEIAHAVQSGGEGLGKVLTGAGHARTDLRPRIRVDRRCLGRGAGPSPALDGVGAVGVHDPQMPAGWRADSPTPCWPTP